MGRGQKRKRAEDEEDESIQSENGEPVPSGNDEAEYCTVKVALSSICPDEFRPHLTAALVYCNQVRVLASLVIKDHLFHMLSTLPPEDPLPFKVNHSYYNRAFTLIRTGKVNQTRFTMTYEASLIASSARVLSHIPAPKYGGDLGASAIGPMLTYMAKQLAENAATHATVHAQDALNQWLRNHVRQSVSQEVMDQHQQQKKRIPWRQFTEQFLLDQPHMATLFSTRQAQVTQLLAAKATDGLIRLMYVLQAEVQTLGLTSVHAMKLMAVLPEAGIELAPLTLDRSIMCHCVKKLNPSKGSAIALGQNEDELWGRYFKLNKIRRLRRYLTFGRSIATDGVAAMIKFQRVVPKQPPKLVGGEKGWHEPHVYPYQPSANFVAIDPGVRAVVTAVSLAHPLLMPLVLGQKQYQDGSLQNYRQHFVRWGRTRRVALSKGTRRRKRVQGHVDEVSEDCSQSEYALRMQQITAKMGAAPSAKSVLPQTFTAYLTALGEQWTRWWECKTRLKWRKVKFFVWRRREAFLEGLVGRFGTQLGPNPVLLFGNGADSGAWGSLRGCGTKGPVKELRARLARRYPVVSCSEYRTSKLCLDCGQVVKTFHHGVSYCCQQSHHRMLNRDVTAAFKIGALYLAQQRCLDLGPWRRDRPAPGKNDPPSTVLRDALSHYQQLYHQEQQEQQALQSKAWLPPTKKKRRHHLNGSVPFPVRL